jgi:hypothetical protein
MALSQLEHGKSRIMAEARAELRRNGIEYHAVMFDPDGSQVGRDGGTLSVSAEGKTVAGWFHADEIADSQDRVGRADVRQKIASLVAGVKAA